MPLYDFKCPGCGYSPEYMMKFEAPNPYCPRCESQLERQISAPNIHTNSISQTHHKPEIHEEKSIPAIGVEYPCGCMITFSFKFQGISINHLSPNQARRLKERTAERNRALMKTYDN